jgi:hypothetical protein
MAWIFDGSKGSGTRAFFERILKLEQYRWRGRLIGARYGQDEKACLTMRQWALFSVEDHPMISYINWVQDVAGMILRYLMANVSSLP